MSAEHSSRTTILNVDDHEASRYSKSRILRGAGYDVVDAASGGEALQLVKTVRPDVVVLDVKLPDIDGYEVCRRIRENPESASTLVLQTSASFVDLNARLRALDGGADNYLSAPFEPEVLIASVRALLRMRRAETELNETRQAFRATFEQAPVGIAHVAADGTCQRVNRRMLEQFGLSEKPEEPFVAWLPESERAEVEAGLARLFRGELEKFVSEQRLTDGDGEAIPVNLTAALVSGPSALRYAIVLVEDLRERKRAESLLLSQQRRLRDSEERFQQFADNSGDVLWIYDVQSKSYEFVSQAFESVWGFTGEVLMKEPVRWLEAVFPADRETVRSSLERVLDGSIATSLYRIRRPDGTMRWIDDRRFPIQDGDLPVRRVGGIAQDVTGARLAEEERAQLLTSERIARMEAEHSNQVKEQFLATLSHELRTPLHSILGWTQLLRLRRTNEIDEGLEVIERNARAQAHLISDLLDVSRIMAGKIRLDAKLVDMHEVVTAACESLRPEAESKSVELSLQLEKVEDRVHGDAARLQQVVWNLVSNAIKFTPAGGVVEVMLLRRRSWIEVRVRDTGQGIAPDYLPHLFERFSQGDPAQTRTHAGLGLGLSIVRSLTELHGGRVHAKSDGEGSGSIFVVELPLAKLTADSADPVMAESGVRPAQEVVGFLAGLRILIVDDEPSGREFVRRLLSEGGARVHSVASGAEALDSLGEFDPDVVISDISMPEMNGYELLPALRARKPERKVPFRAIALTAYARDEDRRRASLAGYERHLSKPVGASELIETIVELARQDG